MTSRGTTANIFPPTLKTRSSFHWTCSVVFSSERQYCRTQSMFIRRRLQQESLRVEACGAACEARFQSAVAKKPSVTRALCKLQAELLCENRAALAVYGQVEIRANRLKS